MEQDPQSLLDQRLVRRAFDRAAARYDAHAVLQQEINRRMLERLEYIRIAPHRLLDAGSGTGEGLRGLRERWPHAQAVALDLAEAMLVRACPQPGLWQRLRKMPTAWPVCGDMEALPVRSVSMDLVWSGMALQWCNQPARALAEFHRVLAPGGLLMFSTFGPDTLRELREAFASVDGYRHVNRFVDMHDLGDELVRAGYAAPVMDMEFIRLTYADLSTMLREIKAIGAHNVAAGRNPGLTGRARWRALESAMERYRQDGRLPLTWEVVYGHAWKPQAPAPDPAIRPVVWHGRIRSEGEA